MKYHLENETKFDGKVSLRRDEGYLSLFIGDFNVAFIDEEDNTLSVDESTLRKVGLNVFIIH